MPDDHLTPTSPIVAASLPTACEVAGAVESVLRGEQIEKIAAALHMHPADLIDAIDLYRRAGHAALADQIQARSWTQLYIHFTDLDTAETLVAGHVRTHIEQLQETRMAGRWWFMRKAPCWRMRIQPGHVQAGDLSAAMAPLLNRLQAEGLIRQWWQSIYEPEVIAFGGDTATGHAHMLFHSDSMGILDYLRRIQPDHQPCPRIGRREISLLLCAALFAGAGQEWHEQGDIWQRVTRLRPPPPDLPSKPLQQMRIAVRRLAIADSRPTGPLCKPGAPLAFATEWLEAFRRAGHALRTEADNGTLTRGLRDVLAHHLIFHWNRLGLPTRTQATLATAATGAIFDQTDIDAIDRAR